MTEAYKKPTRILLPTDLSSSATSALQYAADMAETHGAELHILHVFDVQNYDPVAARNALAELQEALESIEADYSRAVENAAEEPSHRGVMVRSATVRAVSAFDAILGYAEANNMDQIVMGDHGQTDLKYVHLGSVAEKTVRHANIPVLIVKDHRRHFVDEHGRVALERVMFCTDLSEASRLAAPRALQEAKNHNAELLVCHVLTSAAPDYPAAATTVSAPEELITRVHQQASREASQLFGSDYTLHVEVTHRPVANALAEVAKRGMVDLIVMSSQGRQGPQAHAMGSVAERLIRLAPCPICILKHQAQP